MNTFIINEPFHQRYFRKVVAYPEGAIVHHGDCSFFNIDICTCGLLHDLRWYAGKHWDEIEKAYPNFSLESGRHESAKHAAIWPKGR